MERNKVIVTALDKRHKRLEKDLTRSALMALNVLRQKGKAVEVYLVGAQKIRALNRQYRGKDETTNVLAFTPPVDFPKPKSSYRYLGEIYLSPSHIKKQGENINFLLVHGLLHLLGFNHTNVNDRMLMTRAEKQLMAWLNH